MLTKPYDPGTLIDLTRQALESAGLPTGRTSVDYNLRETGAPYAGRDFHFVQNRLAGLLAGIRALRLELLAVTDEPLELRRIIDEYTDRLSAMVKDSAEALKRRG